MANYDELTVDGYVFANPKDAEIAKNEIKKIDYIETHVDLMNLGVARNVYDKAIDERYFQTPIGLEFLRDLQHSLVNSGIPIEDLKPIPLYTVFARINLNESETVKRRMTAKEKNELTLRQKYRNAVLIAAIFGVLAGAMLLITMNGTTPNAINYKHVITNQYSEWEQNLKEREAAVREKERALGLDY